MKRRLVMLLVLLCLLASVFPLAASAESVASKVETYCTVNTDGDCLVSLTATLHLETAEESLTFPLPANASNITMNGASAKTTKTSAAIEVDISKVTSGLTGDFTVRFDYTIPGAVKVNEDRHLQLTLPLLCGFAYPVQTTSFIITLPATITEKPSFTSIYRQTSIESDLKYVVNGNMISGSSESILNDHEGVTMTLMVSEDMFPGVSTYQRTGNPEVIPMLICAGLALLYWLIFLRTAPLLPSRSIAPPESITAGELGCRLTLSGGDLTMMVMSWAQLGYVLIHMDGNGRVLLHKRMDMGNERSLFEIRVFKALFGSRRVVDGTGIQYAKLCRRVAAMVPGEKTMCKASSGNMKVFRVICCGAHVFCGICVAMNMTSILALQILLAIILAVLGAVTAWQIQEIAYRTHLRGKTRVYIGLVCCLVWILLGFLCGEVVIPLCAVLGQFAASYLAAYGGRRSDLNRRDACQILGLRHYLKRISKADIQRMMKNDPDYFFRVAPYALALGVINPFAKNFGKKKLEQCPYLVTKVHGKRTAEEWARLMSQAADMMDARCRRMELEKWAVVKVR